MKKIISMIFMILVFVYVLFATEKLVVDDGTKAKNQATCGGWWYTYNDAESGGNSEVWPEPQKFTKTKDGNSYVARLKGKTGNKLGWDFIGMGVTLSENSGCPGDAAPFDLTKYTTLSFKIKGEISGGRLTVVIPYTENKCEEGKYGSKTLTDWADYEIGISPKVTNEWTVVKIDLRKDLKQPKWAKKIVAISDVLKNAHNINWHFSSSDGDTIDVSIKDIEFN
jgi:hypothetical protein